MSDTDRFEEAFPAIQEVVERTLRFKRANPADIDDATQGVALRIWQGWDRRHIIIARSRSEASWRGYLAKSALHEYASIRRSGGRRRDRELRWSGISLPPAARPGTVRPLMSDSAEIETLIAWNDLVNDINQLSTKRRREVAKLMLLDELTPQEVAAELGIKPRTVRDHFAKATQELRRLELDGTDQPDP